jgi:predicted phage terminase large subunit-like protein
MRQTTHLDGSNCKVRLAQDPGQAGKDQAKRLLKMLAGFSVRAVPVSGSKETRADGFASQVNAGNVRLLVGDWNRDFIEELRTFPKGKNDDQVDAVADAFNELTLKATGSSSFN